MKHGKTFGLFDRSGDIEGVGLTEQGLFHEGTRFLSGLSLTINGDHPLLLSSRVREDNALFTADLSNRDIHKDGQVAVPQGSLHISRSKLLWQAVCYEELKVANYSLLPLKIPISVQVRSDFRDIFEVRGTERQRRGRLLPAEPDSSGVTFSYEGLDGVVRRTRISCSPQPIGVSESALQFDLDLEPRSQSSFDLTIACEFGRLGRKTWSYNHAFAASAAELGSIGTETASIQSSNDRFNEWLRRSLADIDMMVAGNPEPWYPYAGVPWFNTVFGRDGIITALECLWANPRFAKGVLAYLASTQAQERDASRDAEPGKIVHEMRGGEMAALGEVPFDCYYGSVDATPLFVLLAGAYYERTADREFIESIWPNIQRALDWVATDGDPDADGFVEYLGRSPQGLVQQGWKDSTDSVFHRDGALADGPIALCEVQAYVYAAKLYAASLASVLGFPEQADSLQQEAARLQRKFEEAFWCPDLAMYAIALDGQKRPCRVRTSNAGHALFAGIASPEHADATAKTLLSDGMFSGWGVRTVAKGESRYNPISYHNGSVWPHDNALIAAGLARCGLKRGVLKLFDALFDASAFLDLHRLPELYCGFDRRPGDGPTLYPVACSPQSWAAAAVVQMLGSCLGISIDAPRRLLSIREPVLPSSIQKLQIENLRVGEAAADLSFERSGDLTRVNVTRKSGDLQIASE